MNAVTSIIPAGAALDPSMDRAEARLRDLEEVRGVCMFVARMVQKEALALDEPQDEDEAPDQGERIEAIEKIGRVIDRAARSVRLTVILEEKVEKIIRDVRAGRSTGIAAAVGRRRRDAVERVMMTTIRGEHRYAESKIERDREYLEDHLDDEDFIERPVSEVVRRLCNMLGLKPDWSRWADEAWAEEEAEAGIPGSPFRAEEVEAEPRGRMADAGRRSDSS